MKHGEASKLRAKGYDLDLIHEVKNPSPTIYHSDYIQYGEGVATIINVWDYPKDAQSQMWFNTLLGTPNTITQLKIGTENRAKVQKALQDALNANESIVSDKLQTKERQIVALDEYGEDREALRKIANNLDVYKRLYTRIMLIARTPEELHKKEEEFRQNISNFKTQIYLGEMLNHSRQFFIPASKVENLALRDRGFPMNAKALAGTYAFNQTFISDPRGTWLGVTFQNGEVAFDPSHSDGQHRNTAYNLVIGGAGTGKTTWMHQNLDPLVARGDTVWVFDRTRRYVDHIKNLGGLILTMDGSQNMVNIFHVFATVLDDNGNIDVIGSFLNHLEKVENYYRSINPEASEAEVGLLSTELQNFYEELGMWSSSPEDHPEKLKVIGLANDAYPTLEEFVSYLRSKSMEPQSMSPNDYTRLDSILTTFNALKRKYSSKVNGHTNVPDLSKEDLILFDTAGMSEWGANVYSAQYYSILSLMNAYVVMNGFTQLQREKRGEISRQSVQDGAAAPKYFWWVQDEADDIINEKIPQGVIFADKMMRQMRKNYFGLFMIFPGLKEIVADNNQQENEVTKAIRDFFNRFQNHQVGQLSSEEIQRYASITSRIDVTQGQLNALSNLRQGQFLMVIRGVQATFFTAIAPTDDEIVMYGGGM
ncbi:type IV secretion system protein VirB4 [Weissella oryzae SG25]|uniref:Type IV secretion system protein VirB4 n=1 Tax=Weissella oryzae (strain DSM 25784 / JCM 18191 / LMG 30913 / SG25) TaxID=1329250 RepID=A0A069CU78_WEIOS|nr:hypothetical protein [Weissella oryzae]GAK31059.1 type IV secretion system protein VirB4 [Weissella oryzae SG25]